MEVLGFIKSKVYLIIERKILENVDGFYLLKLKLMKICLINNINLLLLNLCLLKIICKL